MLHNVMIDVDCEDLFCYPECAYFQKIMNDDCEKTAACTLFGKGTLWMLTKQDGKYLRCDFCLEGEVKHAVATFKYLMEQSFMHCSNCKHLVFNEPPVSMCDLYCDKYKKPLDYYDGPLKLTWCINNNGKELIDIVDDPTNRIDCRTCKNSKDIIWSDSGARERNHLVTFCHKHGIMIHCGVIKGTLCKHYVKEGE